MKYSLITILNSRGTVSYYVACPYEKKVGEKRCFAPKGTKIWSTLPTTRSVPVYFIQKFSARALRGKGGLIGSFNENCDFRAYTQRIRRPLGGVNLAHNHLRPLKRRRWVSKNPYLELPYSIIIYKILNPHMRVTVNPTKGAVDSDHSYDPVRITADIEFPKGLFTLYGYFNRDKTEKVYLIYRIQLLDERNSINDNPIFKYRNIVTDYYYLKDEYRLPSKVLNLKIGKEYKHLKKIKINGGGLMAFSIKDNRRTGIKKISLKYNNLESVDTKGIEWPIDLILKENGIENLDVLKLGPLRVLKVERNKIQYFDQRKSGISKLKELYLSENKLKEIDFSELKELVVLDVTDNLFYKVSFPKRKYGSSKLKELILSCNELSEIDFSELKELEVLDLSFNSFDKVSFPKSKYKASKLERLYLNNNTLSEVDFSALTELWELYLSYNSFDIFPASKDHVNDILLSLDLSYNPLIKYQKIKSVTVLKVSETQLVHLDLDGTDCLEFKGNVLRELRSFKPSSSMTVFSGNKIPLIEKLVLPRSLKVFNNNVLDSVSYLDLSRTMIVNFSSNELKNLTELRLPNTIRGLSDNVLDSVITLTLLNRSHVDLLGNKMTGLKALRIQAKTLNMDKNTMTGLVMIDIYILQPGDEIQKLIRRIKDNELKSLEAFTVNRKYYTIKDNKLFFEGEEVDEREEKLVGRRRVKARKRSD